MISSDIIIEGSKKQINKIPLSLDHLSQPGQKRPIELSLVNGTT